MSKSLYAFVLVLAALAAATVLLILHDIPAEVFTGVLGTALGGGGAISAQQIGGGSSPAPSQSVNVAPTPVGRQSVFPS